MEHARTGADRHLPERPPPIRGKEVRARLEWMRAKIFVGTSGGVTERKMAVDVSEELRYGLVDHGYLAHHAR
jgi:hypothetical protein